MSYREKRTYLNSIFIALPLFATFKNVYYNIIFGATKNWFSASDINIVSSYIGVQLLILVS